MKHFFKVKMEKIKDCSGESLIETLVSMLIISFSIIMLTTCITGSGEIVKNTKTSFSEYYAGSNVVAGHTGEASANGTVSIKMSGDSVAKSKAIKDISVDFDKIVVNYYKNKETKKASVISYEGGTVINGGGSE